ncbi:rRNA-processing protein EBP2 [Lecanora helva]
MAKSKLLTALDAQKGRNYELERQRKLQKEAAKKKKSKAQSLKYEEKENGHLELDDKPILPEAESEGWESDESEVAEAGPVDTSRLFDSESSSALDYDEGVGMSIKRDKEGRENDDNVEAEEEDDEEDEGIPLSDIESLASEDKADVLPHQRLTINNTSALQKAHRSFALPYSSLPFSAHQTITTSQPVSITDVHDDLTRELAFYKQCLDAANEGRNLLQKEGIHFSRPNDYFAEMVKSDEHMGKIKQKMVDEAANKKAAADARKQRDLKRFGKQVQVAKLQERDKAKRETLDKINLLKRKRKNNDTGATHEEDLFDVALDDAAKEDRSSRPTRDKIGRGAPKRQKRDQKFGFGGKKRFSKSTDVASTADMRGFSAKKMKGKRPSQRPGKSKRARM